jgi:exopolysaccharide biosynthesis polyprenyl glycosylphosphotransferase
MENLKDENIGSRNTPNSFDDKKMYFVVKRLIDILGSSIGLIFLSPVLIVVTLLIKFESKGPVIFSQQRVGQFGRTFKMYKFRSMVQNAEQLLSQLKEKNEMSGPMFKMKDDPRITGVGRFIRKTSIDELPQIINILVGDMSLVGPRPMILPIYNKLNERQKGRSKVLPGITGLAQVNGRNDIAWSKRIEFDLQYCKEFSLLLDLKILFKTFFMVLKSEGVRMDQSACDVDDLDNNN